MKDPPGFSHAPDWMSNVLEPAYLEVKAICERAHAAVTEEAIRQGSTEVPKMGVMALIALGAQVNLQLMAKGIAAKPDADPFATAGSVCKDVYDSAMVSFTMMVGMLAESKGATQQ